MFAEGAHKKWDGHFVEALEIRNLRESCGQCKEHTCERVLHPHIAEEPRVQFAMRARDVHRDLVQQRLLLGQHGCSDIALQRSAPAAIALARNVLRLCTPPAGWWCLAQQQTPAQGTEFGRRPTET